MPGNKGDYLQVKVVLLGKAYAGKTCLVSRYIHERFSDNYQNTIGAAFAAKKLQVQGKNIALNIWDTAGGERYQSMAKMYYRGARAAILCYDLTDKTSFEKIRYWVSELQQNEQLCRIYLCGTKKDLIDNDPNKRDVDIAAAQSLAQDLQSELYETSSLTGENIDGLFHQVAVDYIRNMRSYPENQPKEEEESPIEIADFSRGEQAAGWSKCNSCFK